MENQDAWRITDRLNTEHGKGDPFAAAVRATRMPMIITDPRQPDNPIAYANDAFLKMSGYDRDEVIGHNCRFLQGRDTSREDVARVRRAIEGRTDIGVDLLNYRKDGTTFWNALYISPVVNEDGELLFFFASQMDVSDRKANELRITEDKERFERAVQARTAELTDANQRLERSLEIQTTLLHEVDHRVKNNMQIIASLLSMQMRSIADETLKATMRTTLGRVEAMSTVHRRFYQSGDVSRFDLADFARDLVSDLVVATGRSDIETVLALEPIAVPAEKAAPIALMINELVTNALKHAFANGRGGVLRVAIERQGERCRITVADNGHGAKPETDGPSTYGKRLIQRLGRQLQAVTAWSDAAPGVIAAVDLPVEQRGRGA